MVVDDGLATLAEISRDKTMDECRQALKDTEGDVQLACAILASEADGTAGPESIHDNTPEGRLMQLTGLDRQRCSQALEDCENDANRAFERLMPTEEPAAEGQGTAERPQSPPTAGHLLQSLLGAERPPLTRCLQALEDCNGDINDAYTMLASEAQLSAKLKAGETPTPHAHATTSTPGRRTTRATRKTADTPTPATTTDGCGTAAEISSSSASIVTAEALSADARESSQDNTDLRQQDHGQQGVLGRNKQTDDETENKQD